jgi:hypothetical protein
MTGGVVRCLNVILNSAPWTVLMTLCVFIAAVAGIVGAVILKGCADPGACTDTTEQVGAGLMWGMGAVYACEIVLVVVSTCVKHNDNDSYEDVDMPAAVVVNINRDDDKKATAPGPSV